MSSSVTAAANKLLSLDAMLQYYEAMHPYDYTSIAAQPSFETIRALIEESTDKSMACRYFTTSKRVSPTLLAKALSSDDNMIYTHVPAFAASLWQDIPQKILLRTFGASNVRVVLLHSGLGGLAACRAIGIADMILRHDIMTEFHVYLRGRRRRRVPRDIIEALNSPSAWPENPGFSRSICWKNVLLSYAISIDKVFSDETTLPPIESIFRIAINEESIPLVSALERLSNYPWNVFSATFYLSNAGSPTSVSAAFATRCFSSPLRYHFMRYIEVISTLVHLPVFIEHQWWQCQSCTERVTGVALTRCDVALLQVYMTHTRAPIAHSSFSCSSWSASFFRTALPLLQSMHDDMLRASLPPIAHLPLAEILPYRHVLPVSVACHIIHAMLPDALMQLQTFPLHARTYALRKIFDAPRLSAAHVQVLVGLQSNDVSSSQRITKILYGAEDGIAYALQYASHFDIYLLAQCFASSTDVRAIEYMRAACIRKGYTKIYDELMKLPIPPSMFAEVRCLQILVFMPPYKPWPLGSISTQSTYRKYIEQHRQANHA